MSAPPRGTARSLQGRRVLLWPYHLTRAGPTGRPVPATARARPLSAAGPSPPPLPTPRGRNLFHSYLPGKLTGNLVSPGDVACPPDAATTRTIDGSCNYPDDPLAGAAGTRMGRNVPLEAARPDAANLLNPNPLLVAAKLLHRKPGARPPRVPFLNLWAAAWVQFMVRQPGARGRQGGGRGGRARGAVACACRRGSALPTAWLEHAHPLE